ncbi:MAG: signal recognition particle-docking protein FtsY, partial [Catenulispora sp.]|nr:signal recognition particle-docking protein FtsY [Catenulispora sp.]
MEFLVIGIIIAAIALAGAAALLYRARGRRRPVEQPSRTPVAPPKAQDSPAGPAGAT